MPSLIETKPGTVCLATLLLLFPVLGSANAGASEVLSSNGFEDGLCSWSQVHTEPVGTLRISEVAWMGTLDSAANEWIEIHNPAPQELQLDGYTLLWNGGHNSVTLTGSVRAGWFHLLERNSDNSVPEVRADQIWSDGDGPLGSLDDAGEVLELRRSNLCITVDRFDGWTAGDLASSASAERNTNDLTWRTASSEYTRGLGTPLSADASQTTVHELGTSLLLSDPTAGALPYQSGPLDEPAEAILAAIEQSTTSLDIALGGLSGSEPFVAALEAAAARGVTIRLVLDSDTSLFYRYPDTWRRLRNLPASVSTDGSAGVMNHNFMIRDQAQLLYSTVDWSDTGRHLGYDASALLISDHPLLVSHFQTEFAQLAGGATGTLKTNPGSLETVALDAYLAPQVNTLTAAWLPAIERATTEIRARISNLESASLRTALTDAKARGVQVRVLIDALGAQAPNSLHETLRAAGVLVKTEDWGGRETLHSLVVDQSEALIATQTFTPSSLSQSDDSVLVLRMPVIASSLATRFDRDWALVSNAWLDANADPESTDSAGSLNDLVDNDLDSLVDEGAPEALHSVSEAPDSFNVYFNKRALTELGTITPTNHRVNLEQRLVNRIEGAQTTIDAALYDLNLDAVTDALIARAKAGVRVRVILDHRGSAPGEDPRDDQTRAALERLLRGDDGTIGTADDASVFADSPYFALTDPADRVNLRLPAMPLGLSEVTLTVGSTEKTGYLLTEGEQKPSGAYYSSAGIMHFKFFLFDETWVWTGSGNPTMSGVFGSEANRSAGILGGNSNAAIEIHSGELAAIYTTEFEELWGGSGTAPEPMAANFKGRKADNTSHSVMVGDSLVEVYFSGSDGALAEMTQRITDQADVRADFSIYSWSHQGLVDALKTKFEGSPSDRVGSPTGFQLRGLFDSNFWSQYWSAARDMQGTAPSAAHGARWAHEPDISFDNEDRKLHHKYMVVDGQTQSDPTVFFGSINWSTAGENHNDEDLLIIHDASVADQFVQEFAARWAQAYGSP